MKTPTFEKKSNAIELLIMRDLIQREEEKRKPALEGAVMAEKEKTRLLPKREVLASNLSRMKSLFDQAPRPEPGLKNRMVGSIQNIISKHSQKLPQIDQYDDFKGALAGDVANVIGGETGARLSNFDIQRVLGAIPDIIGDTGDRGLLGWKNLYDTIDDIMVSYKAQPMKLSESSFSQKQLGRAEVLQGVKDISLLNNEQLLGAAEGDVNVFPKVTQEKLFNELKRRELL